jgi:hypothetical protein
VKQAEKELAIFLEFAPVSGLSIDVKTVANRDRPEPDIACEIAGEGAVGFELTELIDRKFMGRSRLMVWTQRHLATTWQARSGEAKNVRFREKYGNASLHFVYRPGTNKKSRAMVAPVLLQELLALPKDFVGTALRDSKNVTSIIEEVRIRRGEFQGPVLKVGSSGLLGDPTALAIRKKLEKNYKCNYPLELLAYIDFDLLPPEGMHGSQRRRKRLMGCPCRSFEEYGYLTEARERYGTSALNRLAPYNKSLHRSPGFGDTSCLRKKSALRSAVGELNRYYQPRSSEAKPATLCIKGV